MGLFHASQEGRAFCGTGKGEITRVCVCVDGMEFA